MNFDEWVEQAARKAYETYCARYASVTTWNELAPAAQVLWLNIARAVLRESKIEVRPSAELAEIETREENERLKKVAAEWSRLVANWQYSAYELRDERDAYKKAKQENDERFLTERDKAREDVRYLLSEFGHEHWQNCDLSEDECYRCAGYNDLSKQYRDTRKGDNADD